MACRSARTLTARSTAVAPGQAVGGVDVGDDLDVGGLPRVLTLLGAPGAPRHPADPRHQHDQAQGQHEPLRAQRVEQRTPGPRRQVGEDHRDGQRRDEGGDRDERQDRHLVTIHLRRARSPAGSQVGPERHGRHRLGGAHGAEGIPQRVLVLLGQVVDDDHVRQREPGSDLGDLGGQAQPGEDLERRRRAGRRAPRTAARRRRWQPAGPACRRRSTGRTARTGGRAGPRAPGPCA